MNSPTYTIRLSQEELEVLTACVNLVRPLNEYHTILGDLMGKLESTKNKIVVKVKGGVAYCDDPRVFIEDYDNPECDTENLLSKIEEMAVKYRNESNYTPLDFGEDVSTLLGLK